MNMRISLISVMWRFILLPYCIAMLSCSGKKIASDQELKAYILDEENGLHKTISKGEVEIELSYRPAELVWANELKEIKNEDSWNELRHSYDSLNYFILHFSRKGQEIESAFVSDPARFTEIISYLSFDMRSDLFMVQEGDTTHALDIMYTRTFGGSSGTSVMAIFGGDLRKKNNDVKICFNDTMLGLGSTQFEFKITDIKNTPTLAFN